MAKILLGANVVQMTGKLGGHVFQRIGNGQTIIRSKVSPRRHARPNFINPGPFSPNTLSKQKEAIAFVSQTWKSLTPQERSTWTGAEYNGLSGYHLYLLYNIAPGQGIVSFRSFPGLPAKTIAVTKWEVVEPPSGQSYDIWATITGWTIRTQIKIFTSAPISVGRTRPITGWVYAGQIATFLNGRNRGTLNFNYPSSAKLPNKLIAYKRYNEYGFTEDPFIPINSYDVI